jgi:hypothetical protein
MIVAGLLGRRFLPARSDPRGQTSVAQNAETETRGAFAPQYGGA